MEEGGGAAQLAASIVWGSGSPLPGVCLQTTSQREGPQGLRTAAKPEPQGQDGLAGTSRGGLRDLRLPQGPSGLETPVPSNICPRQASPRGGVPSSRALFPPALSPRGPGAMDGPSTDTPGCSRHPRTQEGAVGASLCTQAAPGSAQSPPSWRLRRPPQQPRLPLLTRDRPALDAWSPPCHTWHGDHASNRQCTPH